MKTKLLMPPLLWRLICLSILILLLMPLFVLLVPAASADAQSAEAAKVECSKVFVVGFNYNNGLISYKDKVLKCGYSPDKRAYSEEYSEESYTAEILSFNNSVLYSLKFEVPLSIYFDLSDPLINSLSGGMMVLNETNFALIFPYYEKASSIVIYNPRRYKLLSIPLIEERFIQKKSFLGMSIFLVVLLVILAIVVKKIRRPPLSPH